MAASPCTDDQTQKLLADVNSWGLPPAHTCSIDELRYGKSPYGYESTADIKETKDIILHLSSGDVAIRLYIPHGTGPFPIFINLHGGGWVLGNLDSSQDSCQELCNRASCIVVAVDYHLAPEAKFPIPFNDCYEATMWVVNNIADYNGQPHTIVIGGMSAGGNLAAAITLKARDEKSFNLKGQVLMVPVTDCNYETESYKCYADGYLLTTPLMKWFWNHYLTNDQDSLHPYASPLRATSHLGLPPALVMIAEFDPLRDDGCAYADALHNAGVPVQKMIYPSIHGFIMMADRIDLGKEALDVIATHLRAFFKL